MKPKHVLALTIAVLMSACGPGVGGTGRPAESREFVNLAGAQSVPVCSAPWAGLLSCQPPVTGNAVAANHPGTSKVQYASSGGPNPEFVLSFEGNKLSLEGGCPRISFDGEWAQIGSETALFFGGYLSANLIPTGSGHCHCEGSAAHQQRWPARHPVGSPQCQWPTADLVADEEVERQPDRPAQLPLMALPSVSKLGASRANPELWLAGRR